MAVAEEICFSFLCPEGKHVSGPEHFLRVKSCIELLPLRRGVNRHWCEWEGDGGCEGGGQVHKHDTGQSVRDRRAYSNPNNRKDFSQTTTRSTSSGEKLVRKAKREKCSVERLNSFSSFFAQNKYSGTTVTEKKTFFRAVSSSLRAFSTRGHLRNSVTETTISLLSNDCLQFVVLLREESETPKVM